MSKRVFVNALSERSRQLLEGFAACLELELATSEDEADVIITDSMDVMGQSVSNSKSALFLSAVASMGIGGSTGHNLGIVFQGGQIISSIENADELRHQ